MAKSNKYKDSLKRKTDGSYILAHKSKSAKEGDCSTCEQNPKASKLIYRYNTKDMILVREHIEDHLTQYSSHKSITPNWCSECQALIDYKIVINTKKINDN